MSEEKFLLDWFGNFGRILGNPPELSRKRYFSNNPNDVFECVEYGEENEVPAFISAQPFSKYNTVMGIEKLFYDFDFGKKSDNLNSRQIEIRKLKCAKEVQQFTRYLKKMGIEPLIIFSGNKGYHVYVFFDSVYTFDPDQYAFYKIVYKRIMLRFRYKDFKYMDTSVIGDLRRMARIPFSIHQKTKSQVIVVDQNLKPDKLRSLDFYRTYGLKQNIIDAEISNAIKEIEENKKRNKEIRERLEKEESEGGGFSGKIRPCFTERLKLGEMCHVQRLALLMEAFYSGLRTEDEIVDLFRQLHDFREETTRYQVHWYLSHNLDIRPYKCTTIEEKGWCLGEKCSIYNQRHKT
jgi:hypothetical protein